MRGRGVCEAAGISAADVHESELSASDSIGSRGGSRLKIPKKKG